MKAVKGPKAAQQLIDISKREIAVQLERVIKETPGVEDLIKRLRQQRKNLLKQQSCAEKGHPFKFFDKGDGGHMGGRFEEVCSGCGWTNWC